MSLQNQFIDALGGVSKVAKLCEITRSAVSQWKKNRIPPAQFNFLKTKFPDVYCDVFHKTPK